MREPRYQVNVRVDETTSPMFTEGHVTNISRGGLFIETPSPLPIHSPIDLAIHLPEIQTVIRVQGRVAWTCDMRRGTTQMMTGLGIKFVDLGADQLQLLEAYLARVGRTEAPRPRAAAH